MLHLLENRPYPRVSPDPHAPKRHSQDCNFHPLWFMGVPADAVWPAQCWSNIPVFDEQHPAGTLYVFICLDNILMASSSPDQHLAHLHRLFECLQSHGLIVWPDKCAFVQKEIPFLRHLVSSNGMCPLPSKVLAIQQFPKPSDSCGLSKFLRLVHYYHHSTPYAAKILSPIHALVDHKHSSLIIQWNDCNSAFIQSANDTPARCCLLSHPHPTAHSDALDIGIGAVLEQLIRGRWHPLGFFSHRLSTAKF